MFLIILHKLKELFVIKNHEFTGDIKLKNFCCCIHFDAFKLLSVPMLLNGDDIIIVVTKTIDACLNQNINCILLLRLNYHFDS